eukprot:CAMPEP_0175795256 /NCGR_PEP_ID=MMETSP0097-20121207/84378_1 /TAXON_ID=311494 /ORGANISM="Alexandrium monilatum, Strain CCMP3105" /LENGTH=40 /DNA_ID= /DNA_START= /DNA_END= /DNA_ORIENTATION=
MAWGACFEVEWGPYACEPLLAGSAGTEDGEGGQRARVAAL